MRAPASMIDVPAYELVSAPVDVRLERWFDVTLEARGPVDSEIPVALEDVFRIRVRNVSDVERSLLVPRGPDAHQSSIWFEVESNDHYIPNHTFIVPAVEPSHRLAPGAEAVVLGDGGVFGKSDEGWTPDDPGRVRVRATVGHARSNWADVTVR